MAEDPDTPLREETRLLGRLLGEVLRASIGEDGYQRIETIRARAVQQRRDSVVRGAEQGDGWEQPWGEKRWGWRSQSGQRWPGRNGWNEWKPSVCSK